MPIEREATAAAPAEPQVDAANDASKHEDEQADDMDADGSWVEVADADVAKAKAKEKAPISASVLHEAGGQQQASSSSD